MRYALLQLSREFVEEPPQIGIAGFPTIHGMTESALTARIPSFIPFLFREVIAAVVFIFFCALVATKAGATADTTEEELLALMKE